MNDTERIITAWTEVLGDPPEDNFVNFFDSEGDSIDAANFISKLATVLDRLIDLTRFIAEGTIDSILTEHSEDDTKSVDAIGKDIREPATN